MNRLFIKKRRKTTCTACDRSAVQAFVECSLCETHIHQSCVNLTEEMCKTRLYEFICTPCEDRVGDLTEWKIKRRLTEADKEDKAKNYFDVESILDWKTESDYEKCQNNKEGSDSSQNDEPAEQNSSTNTEEANSSDPDIADIQTININNGNKERRFFFVNWKGCDESERSWEPEENLDGCIDMLQKFCKTKRIPYSDVKGRMGAGSSKSVTHNKNCWVTMQQIMDTIERMRKKTFKTDIEVSPYSHEHSGDKIYLLDHNFHCYVVLYYHKEKHGYIADGTNKFMETESIRSHVSKYINFKLIGVRFDLQAKIDHCGGAAACIALAFMQAYKSGKVNDQLTLRQFYSKAIERQLYSEESSSLYARGENLKATQVLRCACGRSFFKINQLQLHARKCAKNKQD